MDIDFKAWPKIRRVSSGMWRVTEKIDGTNGVLYVPESEGEPILAGSRSRWLTVEQDNFGFAAWVSENEEILTQLKPGYHHGEWWGAKIQRRYNQSGRQLSLFNMKTDIPENNIGLDLIPCLDEFESLDFEYVNRRVNDVVRDLTFGGSTLDHGTQPEGVVVHHLASNARFKVYCPDLGKDRR